MMGPPWRWATLLTRSPWCPPAAPPCSCPSARCCWPPPACCWPSGACWPTWGWRWPPWPPGGPTGSGGWGFCCDGDLVGPSTGGRGTRNPPGWPTAPSGSTATCTSRFCWRHLLQEFSAQFRVVALDLRGYGASEKPPGKDNYQLELLVEDIRQVIEALGRPNETTEATRKAPKCVLVGHDWGGLLAWELATKYPTLVEKLVLMDALRRGIMGGFAACHLSQLLRSSYIFLFQLPWLPELLLSLADFELVKTFLMGRWTGIQNPARRLTEEEMDAYLYGLSQPGGLSPTIHYYRNLFRDTPVAREPPPPPTLLLWGTRDAFLDVRLVPRVLRRLRPGARHHLLADAGHWLPEEDPQRIARIIRDFLEEGHQRS
ncbi:epoxide hydrolase 3-like isoform X2 [Cuculus canorus]|uniref:epoxide hydrolase 3-like isoform X2 n=1 Tax=Cuculus canorus TaxID=55661 RepID=UPI0023AB2004|nr:epoxide hydrolase 3-like isoform X2 [Cuculus canorus]